MKTPRPVVSVVTLFVCGLAMRPLQALTLETASQLDLQARYFPAASMPIQENTYPSFALESEFQIPLANDTQKIVITPFVRYDDIDPDRRYADLREFNWSWTQDENQWRAGISRVTWGAMEVFKIVDVLNQKDLMALPDREKLGQPMVSYSTYRGEDLWEVYLLQGLREVEFPGEEGRFRYPLLIDDDNAEYEWGMTGKTDAALRWKTQVGDWEVALSHFYGMNRNPYLVFNYDFINPRLIPVYEKINQTSLDAVVEVEGFIYKVEALFQTGDLERYGAASVGGEYTFSAVNDSAIDITALTEATYDSREFNYQTLYDRDLFVGARVAFNDPHENSLMLGAIVDTQYQQQILLFNWNMNIGEHIKCRLTGSAFHSGEQALDRTPIDAAVNATYDAIDTGRLPLDDVLVTQLLALADDRNLNPRDLIHMLEFLQRDDALRSVLSLTPSQLGDTFYNVMSLSDPSQKLRWLDREDFLQFDVYYYF